MYFLKANCYIAQEIYIFGQVHNTWKEQPKALHVSLVLSLLGISTLTEKLIWKG